MPSAIAVVVAGLAFSGGLLASTTDSERLVPPTPAGIEAASASREIAADTEAPAQPSRIDFSVPAGSKVRQVLLHWEGESVYPSPGDDRIRVNGIGVTGRLISGPTFLDQAGRDKIQSSSFQADITSLGLVASGPNSLTLDGVDFSFRSERAGVRVVLEGGSDSSGTVDPTRF